MSPPLHPALRDWSEEVGKHALERLRKMESDLNEQASDLTTRLHHYSNDAFPFRASLSVFRHAQGDEVAIGVDAWLGVNQIKLSSDICLSDGAIVADGPSLETSTLETPDQAKTAEWLRQFEAFLDAHQDRIVALGLALI